VIKRFEERDRAVDSRGVAEYLRALVVTNAIAEYLPDEESGKPSGIPTLVITLKLNFHVFSLYFASTFSLYYLVYSASLFISGGAV